MTLLKIDNYCLTLKGSDNKALPVLENISFSLKKGCCLGLAGESGSGKSVLAMSVAGLLSKPNIAMQSGSILFNGVDLLKISEKEFRGLRGKEIGFIFQEPMTAMNPLMTLYNQIAEAVYAHCPKASKAFVKQAAAEALAKAGLNTDEALLNSYPHQLSGGMRQRAMIAMATVLNPSLIIADEPTTAIDAALQVQLLFELKKKLKDNKAAMLFISHDLGVIKTIANDLAVLYAGLLAEIGPTDELINSPKHPYTADLISALPRLKTKRIMPKAINGSLPEPNKKPRGCVYSNRCSKAKQICFEKRPILKNISQNHMLACWAEGC